MGEKLEVPVYALKRLVNHSVSNDMTGRYLVLDLDRIRVHMSRITDEFVKLLGINDNDMKNWNPAKEISFHPSEFTQLRISFDDIPSHEAGLQHRARARDLLTERANL
ncbi:MAG TPA: hypothetical protein V6C81_20430 [Planktothrix sp.]|jgi:hypothetical protein